MGDKERKLIAYEELERRIIARGFCTVCGACEAACPIHAIKVEKDKPHRLYDCSDHLDSCPICYDICPHTDAFLYETMRFVSDAPHRRESIGSYRKIVLAQATNPDFRISSRSGGVVTAILNFAINEKLIDGAIGSKASSKIAIKIKPKIHLEAEDTLTAVDTKIVPSAVAEAYGRAVYEYGKGSIAFVGIPCHIIALRKLEAWQHKLVSSLSITIGLFCMWSFSLELFLEYLQQDFKIEGKEIKSIDLGKNEFIVSTTGKTIKIPFSQAQKHILNRCKTCVHFTSQLADLSIGGARPLKDWAIVIIRTRQGETFFNQAVAKGALTTQDIESQPEALTNLLQIATFKREAAMQQIDEMQREGVRIPSGVKFFIKTTAPELIALQDLKINEIMTSDVIGVPPTLTVNQLLDYIAQKHHVAFPVIDEAGKLQGIVTLDDAMKVAKTQRNTVVVGDITTKEVVSVFPGNSAAEALHKMNLHDVGRLLVVDKNDPSALLGILSRSDIMHALQKQF